MGSIQCRVCEEVGNIRRNDPAIRSVFDCILEKLIASGAINVPVGHLAVVQEEVNPLNMQTAGYAASVTHAKHAVVAKHVKDAQAEFLFTEGVRNQARRQVAKKRRREKETGEKEDTGVKGGYNPFDTAEMAREAKRRAEDPTAEELAAVEQEAKDYDKRMEAEADERRRALEVEARPYSEWHNPAQYKALGRTYTQVPDAMQHVMPDDPTRVSATVPRHCCHTWVNAHPKGVSALVWAPKSGHMFVSGGMDGKVKLWDTSSTNVQDGIMGTMQNKSQKGLTGRFPCIRTFHGHTRPITSVIWSEDGTRLATAGFDRRVRIWNVAQGTCIAALSLNTKPQCLSFVPDDDSIIMVGGQNRMVGCWKIPSHEEEKQRTLAGEGALEISEEAYLQYRSHDAAVVAISWLQDRRHFVTSAEDKQLVMWEVNVPSPISEVSDPNQDVITSIVNHPVEQCYCVQSLSNSLIITHSSTPNYGLYGRMYK
ncbi:hypothetical protein KIPB_001514, partial [Kipferlia bialata]|eukprot:g1514.t1